MAEDAAIQDESDDDDAYALDERLVPDVRLALAAGDADRLRALFEPLHPADIADLLEQLKSSERREVLFLNVEGISGEVLTELEDGIREEILEYLPQEQLADAVRDLESDDVVDLLEDLDVEQQEAVLEVLDAPERLAAEKALSYPEYSAGRMMQREVVSVPEHWTAGETIDFLRKAEELPDQFYHVILVDPRHRPTGYVTLGKMMSSPRATAMADIAEESFRTIPVTQYDGDIAYAFNQYHLISAPVVDENDRLVGVITIDDAMTVLDEEHEEDIMRLAGLGEESLSDTTWMIARQRFPWLLVNLITAIIASLVIAQFDETIATIVALAILMPIVASMGGNAGTQSLTVAVRALATRDLTSSNALRVVRREATAGFLNGLAFAVIMGIIGWLWFGLPLLGAVIAVAMVVNLVVAGLAGILIPLALERLGFDPALSSGTFVTTVTDVIGFFAFLGLASVVLL